MSELTDERLKEIAAVLKISVRSIEREAGLHQGTIQKILNKKLTLTEEKASKLLPVLKKYKLI